MAEIKPKKVAFILIIQKIMFYKQIKLENMLFDSDFTFFYLVLFEFPEY